MFVSRRIYSTGTKTDKIDWNKGNNVSVFALTFSSLNRLCAHNELHVSFVIVCSCGAAYTLLMAITMITCVHCMQTSRAAVYKHASF